MLTFVVGLFIGGALGIMFTSLLVLSRSESKFFSKKDTSVSLKSEIPLEENYHGISQKVI